MVGMKKKTKTARKKVRLFPVSDRALRARINRKLAHDEQQLHSTQPGSRARAELGEFYVRTIGAGIWPDHVALEDYGRELGVLQDFEELEDR